MAGPANPRERGPATDVVGQGRAGVDRAKGLLLSLVIFGHTYAADLDEDLGKWLLYGLHMPAFLFVSGYLIRVEALRERPLSALLQHYWHRMLWPWSLVSALFLVINTQLRELRLDSPFEAMQRIVLLPYFHLWYVPVLLVAIMITWACARTRRPLVTLGTVAALGFLLQETPLIDLIPLRDDVDHRYLGYLVWFVAGVVTRAGHYPRLPRTTTAGLVLVGLGAYLVAFRTGGWLVPAGLLVLNLALFSRATVVLAWWGSARSPAGEHLARLGRDSLWIYLLHPLVTVPYTFVAAGEPWSTPVGALLTVVIVAVSPRVVERVRTAQVRSGSRRGARPRCGASPR